MAVLQTQGDTTGTYKLDNDVVCEEIEIEINASVAGATINQFFGASSNSWPDNTDSVGVYFYYSNGTNTLQTKARVGSNKTTNSYDVTLTPNQVYNFKIIVTGGVATFYLDGSLISTITTNVPSNSFNFGLVHYRSFGTSHTTSGLIKDYVAPAPDASFTYSVSGDQVRFTDTSSPAATSWDWDFGDGSPHSILQNPTHRYAREVLIDDGHPNPTPAPGKPRLRTFNLINHPEGIQIYLAGGVPASWDTYDIRWGDLLIGQTTGATGTVMNRSFNVLNIITVSPTVSFGGGSWVVDSISPPTSHQTTIPENIKVVRTNEIFTISAINKLSDPPYLQTFNCGTTPESYIYISQGDALDSDGNLCKLWGLKIEQGTMVGGDAAGWCQLMGTPDLTIDIPKNGIITMRGNY